MEPALYCLFACFPAGPGSLWAGFVSTGSKVTGHLWSVGLHLLGALHSLFHHGNSPAGPCSIIHHGSGAGERAFRELKYAYVLWWKWTGIFPLKQVESEVESCMKKALKLCSVDENIPQHVNYMYRAATIHHRLASLNHNAFRNKVCSGHGT